MARGAFSAIRLHEPRRNSPDDNYYEAPGNQQALLKPDQFWKNFKLGEELDVAGTFIYNGVRRFYELRKLDHTDEIFEVFYYPSIGLER